ncbi:hypothetical protein C5O80_34180 [Burkholderia sp. SRS-46]|nr:hypothetical protein C5O80_34180 [Burkholderia sp. SRS-46]
MTIADRRRPFRLWANERRNSSPRIAAATRLAIAMVAAVFFATKGRRAGNAPARPHPAHRPALSKQ